MLRGNDCRRTDFSIPMKYHVTQNGRQVGELDEAKIQEMLGSGQLSPQDLGWRDGMGGWEPLSRIFPYHVGPAGMAVPYGYGATGGDQPLAGRLWRLLAWILDWVIFMLAFVPMSMQMVLNEAETGKAEDLSEEELLAAMSTTGATGMMITAFLVLGLLVAHVYFLTTRGQTLGKMVCRIRIVDLAGQNPGFVKAVLLRFLVNWLICAVPLVGLLYRLTDALAIFRQDRRCAHDQIAGTQVVTAPKKG